MVCGLHIPLRLHDFKWFENFENDILLHCKRCLSKTCLGFFAARGPFLENLLFADIITCSLRFSDDKVILAQEFHLSSLFDIFICFCFLDCCGIRASQRELFQ